MEKDQLKHQDCKQEGCHLEHEKNIPRYDGNQVRFGRDSSMQYMIRVKMESDGSQDLAAGTVMNTSLNGYRRCQEGS